MVISGAKRKNEKATTEEAQQSQSILLKDEKEAEKLALNSFYQLEHKIEDQKRTLEILPQLERIQSIQNRLFKNDYASSKLARSALRVKCERGPLYSWLLFGYAV